MKVAVNLTWLAPGRVGGSEEYLTRQLSGLEATDLEIDLYCDSNFGEHHPDLTQRFTAREMQLPFASSNRLSRIVLEHTWLPACTRSHDVVHHGGGTIPLVSNRPILLTIHDLQYRRFPEYFSRVRLQYLRSMMPRSARTAAVIAVPSEFVRADVIEAFEVPEDRVVVVPHGVPDGQRPKGNEVRTTLDRHNIADRPYVIYPAITHPHKGHTVLVDMLEELDDDTSLVLIGGQGHAEGALTDAIAASVHSDRVVRLGRVSADERDALLAGATAMVFPSEFEGFGAPIVEAMALGTPVVCSASDAVVEVVGDAGVVVEERTGAAWAAGVAMAQRERAQLVDRGHQRRAQFTVSESGRALEDAYRMAAS